MLSIGNAHGRYYANLAAEDYYHAGGEPPGVWHGRGAGLFGLYGQVDKEEFLRLCDGFTPKHEKEKLVQNAGKENHRAGWDLTFSAPKSVSVLWALGSEETRKTIQRAQLQAVREAITYIEDVAAYARSGEKGDDLEPCLLSVALYEHGTSRAQDPQLHTHAVVLNVGIREDGTTATLEGRHFMRHKMAAGALYRAELAHILERDLQVEIREGIKETFEIAGVPDGLIEEFSKRRAAIEEAMEKEGAQGAARSAYFTLTTREKKEHIAREVLFDLWQEVGRKYDFTESSVLNRLEFVRDREVVVHESLHSGIEKITSSQAYFPERDLVRRVAEAAQTRRLGADGVREVIGKYLDGEAIHLRTRGTDKLFTTPEIDQLEKKMLRQVEMGRDVIFEAKENYESALGHPLNLEQKKALFDITHNVGNVKVVSGMAGTGKTTMLRAAREAWEAQGFEVKGATLAAVAAKGLEEGAGIKSGTIAKLLLDIENAANSGTGKDQPLTAQTILVIDEAAMVGTPQLARLIDEATQKRAKLVLVGDERQLQPIEHGGPFKAIGEIVGRSELTEITRQREGWAREAVKNFAGGDAQRGLREYVERDLLTITTTRKEAEERLIIDWRRDLTPLNEKLILSNTRHSTKSLNQKAQEIRSQAGELGEEFYKVNGQTFFINDRVLFTKNKKSYGVINGDIGTLKKIDKAGGHFYVRLDSGNLVTVPTAAYQNIELGYAMTTHKGQGRTVTNAYILGGDSMQDRELSYVQMSRAKEATRLYLATDDAGKNIAELAALMNRSRQKEIAQSIRDDRSVAVQKIEPEGALANSVQQQERLQIELGREKER